MKRIAILGSTGSIGLTTLNILRRYKKEFALRALSAHSNIGALKKQIVEFKPQKVAVFNEELSLRIASQKGCAVYCGIEGLAGIASDKEVDIVVIAISGAIALYPLLAAIDAGKQIALANKEALVMAGQVIMERLKNSKAKLIPVDSEQSAIFQCLEAKDTSELHGIYLTASGGSLHEVARKDFKFLNPEKILAHPRWKMGRKITVDSATLMNKGLEVIEAQWLFNTDVSRIKVLIHRQAIIHSMVEFVDGVVLAQLGVTDMTLPLQYALSYPKRLMNDAYRLDFGKFLQLTFEQPNTRKFPCLDFAYRAALDGGTAPAVMNAVNEEAVNAFLDERLSFTAIPRVIEKIMSRHKIFKDPDLDSIVKADSWARQEARGLISNKRRVSLNVLR